MIIRDAFTPFDDSYYWVTVGDYIYWKAVMILITDIFNSVEQEI